MPSIYSYDTAADYLGRKSDRPLPGRASRIIRRAEDAIAIKYQATDVVTYHADGTATLQSGGWQTFTTKARFTEYTRARVYAVKGQWYVRMGTGWDDTTPPSLYYNGMRISADGLPIEPRYPSQTDQQRKRELDRKVAKYIKGFAASIVANGLENPSGGDCWGCCMQVKDAPAVECQPFGRVNRATLHGRMEPMGIDHYLSHFEEEYFVPSLLFNAIKARGYRDPGVIWYMIQSRKDGKFAAEILRGYFKNLKPALLAELSRQAA